MQFFFSSKFALYQILCIMLDYSHDKGVSLYFYSIMEMAKGILEATFTHSKNLACFVFVYKTLTNLMAWFETHEKQYQSFIAAFIGGYFVFGKYNKVNEQVCKEMHMIFKDVLFQIYLPWSALYIVRYRYILQTLD